MPRMSLKQAVKAAGVKRRGSTFSRVARQSTNRAFQAPRNVRPELKDVDTAIASNASTTAVITLVNGIAQGSDDTQRIGRAFTVKSFQFRGTLIGGSAQSVNTAVRVMLVYDKQANSAAPVIGDIIQTTVNTYALTNLNQRQRFDILWDKVYPIGILPASGTLLASSNIGNLSIYRKLSLATANSGTGATAASIARGALYFVVVGDVALGGGTATPTLTGVARIRFLDS